MREVSIVGVGQTQVGEHWEKSLKQLAAEAIWAAIDHAQVDRVDAIYVGNMLSGELTGQQHLGALIADHAALVGAEAIRVEAGCGSGGAALRAGYGAVASGLVDVVVVVGVEKMTDQGGPEVTQALAAAADRDTEAEMGLSFVSMNALLMRRYMYEHRVEHAAFAAFITNAHANGLDNPAAMLRSLVSTADYERSRMIADPICVLDSSPIADGAAAVVLCASAAAREARRPCARILACTVATDTFSLHARRDPLTLDAVAASAARAYDAASVRPADIGIFEAHDAFSIITALSLEACGFAARGRALELADNGEIARGGRLPLSTMGGLKARGHPIGASGVYQVVELWLQLNGRAGKNQVAGAKLGMAQSIGGCGATAVTTILEAG